MKDTSAWAAVAIDDVESIDWRGSGIDWRPVRRALDIDFVGVAAYVGQTPGQIVVEPHTEVDDGRGQQELYVVIRGAARFVLDGQQIDAPAGTLIRVDPQVHRQATAVNAGTVVLALGGESTFQVAGAEWVERARPFIRSDPARAIEIIDDLRRQLPDSRAIDIGEALLAVGSGDTARAHDIVSALIREHPDLRPPLLQDPELRNLLS